MLFLCAHHDVIPGQCISFADTRHASRHMLQGERLIRDQISQTKWPRPLIGFLKTASDLNMSNDPKESTTKYGATTDKCKRKNNVSLCPADSFKSSFLDITIIV
jgi:hypothetical protein